MRVSVRAWGTGIFLHVLHARDTYLRFSLYYASKYKEANNKELRENAREKTQEKDPQNYGEISA